MAALAVTGGCDRQDNDWGMYDPALKLVHIPSDTLFVEEVGGSATFTVSIGMVPQDTVFVYPASGNSQVFFRPDSLVFAPVDDDWLNPRTIAVEAFEDQVEEGEHSDLVNFEVRSHDPDYHGQAFDLFIPVVLADNDLAGVAVSETLLTLVESDLGSVFQNYRLVLQSQPTASVTVTANVVPEEPSLHMDPVSVTFDDDRLSVSDIVTALGSAGCSVSTYKKK